VIWQNLTIATSVIIVLIASALGFSLPLTLGVVGHEGSTVLVCLNGLRLLAFGARESTDCAKALRDRIDEAKSVV
jgi:Cd2+/Zn2+-exporting ATPase